MTEEHGQFVRLSSWSCLELRTWNWWFNGPAFGKNYFMTIMMHFLGKAMIIIQAYDYQTCFTFKTIKSQYYRAKNIRLRKCFLFLSICKGADEGKSYMQTISGFIKVPKWICRNYLPTELHSFLSVNKIEQLYLTWKKLGALQIVYNYKLFI